MPSRCRRLVQGENGPEILGLSACTSLLHNRLMIYGYARVSTDRQSEAAQVRQVRAAGAGKVFREVAIGAKTDRAQLRRVLSELGPGDVLMVTRLDRLARSTRDLLNTLASIPEEEIWLQKQKSARTRRAYPRRAALHAHAGDHRAGGTAPGGPQGGDRLGALYA